MRLGNSASENKGKKYFLRSKAKHSDITKNSRQKAELFSKWFKETREELVKEMVARKNYDPDILTSTYIRIYEKVLYTGMDIACFKAYFHRAYFTNNILDKTYENRYVNSQSTLLGNSPIVDATLEGTSFSDTTQYHKRIMEREQELKEEILNYVKYNCKYLSYQIIKLILFVNINLTLDDMSKTLGVPAHQVQRCRAQAFKAIRNNKKLVEKYNELYSRDE